MSISGLGGFSPSSVGFSGFGGTSPSQLFNTVDGNGDGKLTLDEFKAGAKSIGNGNGPSDSQLEDLFKKIDTKGTGTITKDDLKSFDSKVSSALQGKLLDIQEQLGQSDGTQAGNPLEELFKNVDANGDGKLSKDEFKASIKSQLGSNAPSDSQIDDLFDKISKGGQSISKSQFADFAKQQADKSPFGSNATPSGSSANFDPVAELLKNLGGDASDTGGNSNSNANSGNSDDIVNLLSRFINAAHSYNHQQSASSSLTSKLLESV